MRTLLLVVAVFLASCAPDASGQTSNTDSFSPVNWQAGELRRFNELNIGGAYQLFRRACYEDIGGYLPLEAGGVDTVAGVMARQGFGNAMPVLGAALVALRTSCRMLPGTSAITFRFLLNLVQHQTDLTHLWRDTVAADKWQTCIKILSSSDSA